MGFTATFIQQAFAVTVGPLSVAVFPLSVAVFPLVVEAIPLVVAVGPLAPAVIPHAGVGFVTVGDLVVTKIGAAIVVGQR